MLLCNVLVATTTLWTFLLRVSAGPAPAPRPHPKRFSRIASGNSTGHFFVGLRDGKTKEDVFRRRSRDLGYVKDEWKEFSVFSVETSEETLSFIHSHEDVLYVEEEGFLTMSTIQSQDDAPWSLSRISSTVPLTNQDDSALNYSYSYNDAAAGAGVNIYVVDSGIRTTHEEFGGRASIKFAVNNLTFEDGDGHGTLVAGVAAGRRFGVAKAANLIGARILDDQGHGSMTDAFNALAFVLSDVQKSGKPSVVVLSLEYPNAVGFDTAVRKLVAVGTHVVVAAGNRDPPQDAFNISPASTPEAVTVGATDINDNFWGSSNFGAAIDISAPGVDVTSSWNADDNATRSASGTSLSAPYVAGLVASLISRDGNITPAQMSDKLKSLSQAGVISNLPAGTPNFLAYNGVPGEQFCTFQSGLLDCEFP